MVVLKRRMCGTDVPIVLNEDIKKKNRQIKKIKRKCSNYMYYNMEDKFAAVFPYMNTEV